MTRPRPVAVRRGAVAALVALSAVSACALASAALARAAVARATRPPSRCPSELRVRPTEDPPAYRTTVGARSGR